MRRSFPTLLRLFLFSICCFPSFLLSHPRLVVGIVVDQMRYDYLDKYKKKFGPDGFRRLMKDGFSCSNTNYNYVPTFTGPGHASIYTGTTPSVHGIISNDWVDAPAKKKVYCVGDKSVQTVGAANTSGQVSPKNLFTSTVSDEIQQSTGNKSKVIGISLKDRSAILPVGKYPTAAYWYDGSSGCMVTSTYYMKTLPAWVSAFNKQEYPKRWLTQSWNTLLPVEKYTESGPDDSDCEEPFKGKAKAVFPYDLSALSKENGQLGLLRSTPYGNTLVKDFALEAIRNEGMGQDTIVDFLSVSFSATDYIGHQFGPGSVEVEDCFLRMDQEIAALLKFLDETIGKQNYLLFLTSDHGAADAVPCSLKKNIPAGNLEEKTVADSLRRYYWRTYKDSLLLYLNEFDVYLKHDLIEKKKLNPEEVEKKTAAYLVSVFPGIADAVPATEIRQRSFQGDSIRMKIKAGYHPQRSGDVFFVQKPNWLLGYAQGTSHGSPYYYDTHVPLIFFGWKVKKGSTGDAISITDIAPTVSSLLGINNPGGCTGVPINKLTE